MPLAIYPSKKWPRPPRWHYGYAAYFENGVNDMFVQYALKNPQLKIPLTRYEPSGVYLSALGVYVDIYCTLTGVMNHFNKKLGNRDRFGRSAMDGTEPIVVLAFCNNYSTKRSDHPDIRKAVTRVKLLLGADEYPKWFIDDDDWIDPAWSRPPSVTNNHHDSVTLWLTSFINRSPS